MSSASQTLETQRTAIASAARARGTKIARWYAEKQSGGTMQRPALEQLRADVRGGRVSVVYVYRLDRLTRTGIRDTLGLVDEFKRAGAELLSIADGFDVAGAAAEVVLAVIAWAARMERLALSERIRAARARVERQGGSWGRPRRLTDGQIVKARELRAKGHSVRIIAMTMHVPKSTIQAAVSRKPPRGKPTRPTGKRLAGES